MSDERADAIPEAAVEAAMRAAYDAFPQSWGPTGNPKTYEECYGMTPLEHTDDVAEMRAALAAAAPHMAGGGEAERIVAALRSYSDDVDRVRAIGGEVARISHRLADYIEREFVHAAQPDAERAPQQNRDRALNEYMAEHGPNAQRRRRDAERRNAERAGNGEAERIVAWLRDQADGKDYAAACEWRNVADAIERENEDTDSMPQDKTIGATACDVHRARLGRDLTSHEVMAVLTGVQVALSRLDDAGRCLAPHPTDDDAWCCLRKGHTGPHLDRGETWPASSLAGESPCRAPAST